MSTTAKTRTSLNTIEEAIEDIRQGKVIIVGRHTDSNIDEIKKFLKEAQQTREKIVAIEGLVVQIREYHGKIIGGTARNEYILF